MPDIIDRNQGHIAYKHLFIFCGFYCFNIQAKSKENRFFIQFYGLGVYLRHLFLSTNLSDYACQSVNYMLLNGRSIGCVR